MGARLGGSARSSYPRSCSRLPASGFLLTGIYELLSETWENIAGVVGLILAALAVYAAYAAEYEDVLKRPCFRSAAAARASRRSRAHTPSRSQPSRTSPASDNSSSSGQRKALP